MKQQKTEEPAVSKYDYLMPKTIDEAISLFASHAGKAKYIAGGTDVMVKIKERKINPQYLVSLKHLQGLDHITYKDGELRIGALVTHRRLEVSPIIKNAFPIIIDAVSHIGSVQIRNVGTIGGNIVNGVPSADGSIPLITLGCSIRIVGPKGERTMALEDFFIGPGQTLLEAGEILLEFIVPPLPPYTGSAYWKHTRRAAMELPLLGVAVMVSMEKDMKTCKAARIGMGVLAPTPIRARYAEEKMKGKLIDETLLKEVGKTAADECKARDSTRGLAWYRKDMVEVLFRRMALLAMDRAQENMGDIP
jgi:carbon-monoxide dehydrogenase medium subunit